jgi:hypothetical protein
MNYKFSFILLVVELKRSFSMTFYFAISDLHKSA